MNSKAMHPLLLIGLIGVFTIGSSFVIDIYRAFYGNDTVYWTHRMVKMPLAKTSGDVQVFIAGKSLQEHADHGTLIAINARGGHSPVAADDITVRLNNWHKIKAGLLTKMVWTGFALGINLTLLATGAVLTLSGKKISLPAP